MLKVFIADDSDLVRERLAVIIAELGNAELVGYAEDVPEAITAIRRLRPDVAILDIRLPSGNGIQILEATKADGLSPLIIMLTAFPFPQYRKRCMEAGADFFFDKLTEFERVAQVIRDLEERGHAYAEH